LGQSGSREGKPPKANRTRQIAISSVAALPLAGAALLFYEVLLAIFQSSIVVTEAGWLFTGGLSVFFGCVVFAALTVARINLAWRFVVGGITALLVASGLLFLGGLLIAIMSSIS